MPWTERQQAMLRAMGLRVWAPAAPPADRPMPGGEAEPVAGPAAPSMAPSMAGPVAASIAEPPTATPPARRPPSPPPPPAATGTPPPARAPSARDTPRRAPAAARPAAPDPGRAAHIATLDWPALREAAAACCACGLAQGRRQVVFGSGGTQAHWMVVGEAPGEQEDRQGEPFVGPAGQLLDRMLAALGLTRDPAEPDPARQVYIANTLKCRPPANRNPAPDELAQCEPFLMRQIELLQPRIILAMGRFAVQSLLRTPDAIGQLRGRVHRYQGVPLVVTYHPAYLLRNLPDKARAWQDLCLAAATVEGG